MEITLADLLRMEPRLRPGTGLAAAAPEFERTPVSWAVTARTTSPHLPVLRGGELLLLPKRALAAIGEALPALMRESAARGVSGVAAAADAGLGAWTESMADAPQWFFWTGAMPADTETEINRLLNDCRGLLYRVGTDLERRLAEAAVNQAGLAALAAAVAEATGLGVAVTDAQGRPLAGVTEGSGAVPASPFAVAHPLQRGAVLRLFAARPEQRVLARGLSERIAAAANEAMRRDEAARPRGAQRAEAAAQLLTPDEGNASEQRARALALGLDPDALFLVAVSDSEAATLGRMLAPLGAVLPAGERNGRRIAVIAMARRNLCQQLSGKMREVAAQWERDVETAGNRLALSAPAEGVSSLPRAAQEAEFVAALQRAGGVTRRGAAFGSVDDVGVMGLLFQLRESAELRGFVAAALGALPANDPRGTLRATLRAFLDSGGAQVAASQRLGIHRNTLAYRLRRIGELVGRDVADPGAWLTLHLAIRAADLLDAAGQPW